MCYACSDFFEPSNQTILKGDNYMKELSEMYAGYMGITTKLQAIGDKSIYLNDTRGELLEITENSSGDLYSIYNYEKDLKGNIYADPAPYYDVIIACNDYLFKIKEYRENRSGYDLNHYKGLVSCALRVKAWTYLTMGKIYGQVVWFDDPLFELEDIADESKFQVKNLEEIIDACVQLLENGYDIVDKATYDMPWYEWISSDADIEDVGLYTFWDIMAPPYFVLAAELALWQERYQDVVDLILPKMDEAFASSSSRSSTCKYMRNAGYNWEKIFQQDRPATHAAVAVICYDYTKGQTNQMLKHFGTESPNEYLLKPSVYGMERYKDSITNPGGNTKVDTRYIAFTLDDSGRRIFRKYRGRQTSRTYAYQDDVHIYMYHSAELYFMLMESLNHLGRYNEMYALMNEGVDYYFPGGDVSWAGFTDNWTATTRSYGDRGIRTVMGMPNRELKIAGSEDIKKYNDLQILDEILLDLAGEGKTYPAMLRIARRYNDYNIIADRVVPKYEERAEEIRAKIHDGGYFIYWDLFSYKNSK